MKWSYDTRLRVVVFCRTCGHPIRLKDWMASIHTGSPLHPLLAKCPGCFSVHRPRGELRPFQTIINITPNHQEPTDAPQK